MSTSGTAVQTSPVVETSPQECLTCRIIGTVAFAATGLYALNQSRAHAPGSVVGKRIMAGVGVCKCHFAEDVGTELKNRALP